MTGHEKSLLWISAISVTLNVLGNALLIPKYGMAGAAAATAASLAFGEILKYAHARRCMAIDASVFCWVSEHTGHRS